MTGALVGVRVVVTRPGGQAAGLVRGFREAGAEVECLGLLEVGAPSDVEPLRRAAAEVGRFPWVAFTSANAVAPVFDLLPQGLPSSVAVAAVGEATARALRQRGIEPRLVSRQGSGEGLAEEMAAGEGMAGACVLLPLAGDARPELAAGLRGAGAVVTEVVAYEKRVPAGAGERVCALFPSGAPLGWVTFTSPRIAATFAELVERHAGGWAPRRPTLRAASIGATTSAALRRLGVEPAAEAATPGDRALVRAVARAVG
jgi:uroporphyrinogen III methyltransferase/synthase